MNQKIINPLIFVLSFLVMLVAYWPAINGTPIWDDFNFWFNDPVMGPESSYIHIWKNYAWPFSVSFQKMLFAWWNKSYFNYHLLSLTFHFANALLVYKLVKVLRIKHPTLLFLAFLFHPSCVMTTAWMIQLKTLLCFFFGIIAFLTFLKGNKDYRWMVLSWVLFFFSITSKSASLTLPFIFFIISFKFYGVKKLHLLIPFLIISSWGTYNLFTSSVTLEGSKKAVGVITSKPSVKVPEPQTYKHLPQKELPVSVSRHERTLPFLELNPSLVAKTSHYYFWQGLIPSQTVPVKGHVYENVGAKEVVHVLLLIILIILLYKEVTLLYLAGAYILLLPFLGIVPAPFMTITWVSDQHLYLALPALLAFWFSLLGKIKWKYSALLPAVFLIFFIYKTVNSTPYYKNQLVFYEVSYRYNPYNVPIAYNLAFAYLTAGDFNKAKSIVTQTFEYAQHEPHMKRNRFFPYIARLYIQMNQTREENEN